MSADLNDLETQLRSRLSELTLRDLPVPQTLLSDIHRRFRRDRQRRVFTTLSTVLILGVVSALAVARLPYQHESRTSPTPATPATEEVVQHLRAVGDPTWFRKDSRVAPVGDVRGYALDGSPSFVVYDGKALNIRNIPNGTVVHVIWYQSDNVGVQVQGTISRTAPVLSMSPAWPNTGQMFVAWAWLPSQSVRMTYTVAGRVVVSSNVIDGVGAVMVPHWQNLVGELGSVQALDGNGRVLVSQALPKMPAEARQQTGR
jgi:hypothetical protein